MVRSAVFTHLGQKIHHHHLRTWRTFFFILIGTWSLASPWAQAQSPKATGDEEFKYEEAQIPKQTTAPPSLSRRAPENQIFCQRKYSYRGKLLPCDSIVYRDGEQLRPILNAIPEAIGELNIYQENRRSLNKYAYTTTIGLALILAGQFTKNLTGSMEGIAVRNIMWAIGIPLTVGSVGFAFHLLNTNEEHLGNAVHLYNTAHPKDPIELQFTTGVSF